MLAGLLFAVRGADDRAGALVATLPFAGVTLIEYQARLLIEAGATQLVVVVARPTPELAGATARVARGGVTVDTVRSAGEAAQRLHPLARVLALADGLVTTVDAVAPLAFEGGDTLLVVQPAAPGFELVGSDAAWAGAAGFAAARLAEVAALPTDYDPQSTLIRVVAQGGARHLRIAPDALRAGHGIERRAAALAERGHAILAATVSGRRGWFDRWVIAPLARRALPALMARGTGTLPPAAGAAVLALGGIALTVFGWGGVGLALTLLGIIAALGIATLAWMRDERALRRALTLGAAIVAALAALALGYAGDAASGGWTALVAALAAVTLAGLAERAALDHRRRRWWGSPPAYLALLIPFAAAGRPAAGLVLAAGYAALTLGAAIEDLRRHD